MSPLKFVTILLAVILQYGCQQNNTDVTWYNAREYTLTLYNGSQPILEVDVSYIGKKPSANVKVKHNWQQQDTDFYQVKFTNLFQESIHFESIVYELEKGKLLSKKVKNKQGIAADCGFVKILPGNSMLNESAYVWSYANSNTLHRYFNLTVAGKNLTVDFPLVYLKSKSL